VYARQLCESLYRGLLAPSEEFLMARVETSQGALAPTPKAITLRLRRP